MFDLQKTRLPLNRILLSPEFAQLSEKRRAWVARLIATETVTGNFDPVAATKAVFTNANPRTVATMSYALVADRKIQRVLSLFWQQKRDPLEDEILPQLATVIAKALRADKKRGRISVATVKALAFYDKHSGKTSTPQSEAPQIGESQAPTFRVGDLVEQQGHIGRVMEVDSDGRPTRVEEVHVR
jgi:hypothetical protein